MSAGCALTPADRYSTKMASEGASGEQPPPVQTLATAVLGSVDTVRHGGSGRGGRSPGGFCRCGVEAVPGKGGRNAVRIYFAQAREATAVASGSLATASGEKQGARVGFRLPDESEQPRRGSRARNAAFSSTRTSP